MTTADRALIAAFLSATLATVSCSTTRAIPPGQLERLDGYKALPSAAASPELETVDHQKLSYTADSRLYLDLPGTRVGGAFNSIHVSGGVFDGVTYSGQRIQAPLASIQGASVNEPDKRTTVIVVVGIFTALILGVAVMIATSPSQQAVSGRALRVQRRAIAAPLAVGIVRGDGWNGQPGSPLPDTDSLSRPARVALAEAWTSDALAEHASVPAFARLSLTLMALGAPSRLVEAAHRAALEEIQHARLAFSIAAAYAGAPVAPGGLSALCKAPAVTALSLPELALESLVDGCLMEGVAAAAAREGATLARDPAIQRALVMIARDETSHAQLAWDVVEWCLAESDETLRRHLQARLEAARCPTPPSDGPPHLQAELASHGRLTAAVWRELFEATRGAAAGRLAARVIGPRGPAPRC